MCLCVRACARARVYVCECVWVFVFVCERESVCVTREYLIFMRQRICVRSPGVCKLDKS